MQNLELGTKSFVSSTLTSPQVEAADAIDPHSEEYHLLNQEEREQAALLRLRMKEKKDRTVLFDAKAA